MTDLANEPSAKITIKDCLATDGYAAVGAER